MTQPRGSAFPARTGWLPQAPPRRGAGGGRKLAGTPISSSREGPGQQGQGPRPDGGVSRSRSGQQRCWEDAKALQLPQIL